MSKTLEAKTFASKYFLEATNPLLCKIFLALKHEHDLTQNLQKLFEESSLFFAFPTKLTPHRKISYTTTPVLLLEALAQHNVLRAI